MRQGLLLLIVIENYLSSSFAVFVQPLTVEQSKLVLSEDRQTISFTEPLLPA